MDPLRRQILELTKQYYQKHMQQQDFKPGETYVNYAGRVFDEKELCNLVDSSLDFWLTAGRYAESFEKKFASYFGVRSCLLTNSGSSANLLALTALTSEKLGEKRLQAGDEVITVAASFPTTIAPIYQNQLVPVYCDIDLATNNINIDQLQNAISDKTKAIFMAHTLGNPFNIDKVLEIKKKYNLWLIEDNCDALGAEWGDQKTGSFGDISTCSFYPAHHITMGEGGALATDSPKLKKLIRSFRDWGKDCWCDPGQDNTCGKRFDHQLGKLPLGYDHKYIFSHIGYNLKLTDMQAAIGMAQLEKLSDFVQKRRENFQLWFDFFRDYPNWFILPAWEEKAKPSWFGFFLIVKPEAPFSKNDFVRFLEQHKIATRTLFGGNIIAQPAYQNKPYRIVENLKNSDIAMNNGFWMGVYPGIDGARRQYVLEICERFLKQW